VRQDPVGLGFHAQRPIPELPEVCLIHVVAERALRPADLRVPGRVLCMRVYVPTASAMGRATLPKEDGPILNSGVPIIVRPADGRDTSYGRLAREYFTSLGSLLADSPEETTERLNAFVRACFDHLQATARSVAAPVPVPEWCPNSGNLHEIRNAPTRFLIT
jgi:hypothetical protein